jgi:hypothetical protein
MFDDRLHIDFAGGYCQPGYVVVASSDIRFEGILTQ